MGVGAGEGAADCEGGGEALPPDAVAEAAPLSAPLREGPPLVAGETEGAGEAEGPRVALPPPPLLADGEGDAPADWAAEGEAGAVGFAGSDVEALRLPPPSSVAEPDAECVRDARSEPDGDAETLSRGVALREASRAVKEPLGEGVALADGEEGPEGDAVRLGGAEAVASEGEGSGEGEGAPGDGDARAVGVLASAPGVGV